MTDRTVSPALAQDRHAVIRAAALGLFLALAVRLPGLAARDPWIDEAYSAYAISRGWSDLVADRLAEGHSPLWFALMKASGIDPGDILALRAVSAGFDALACAVLAATLARLVSARAGLLMAVLYATAPLPVLWSLNARPYGLMLFFLALGVAGAAALMVRPRSLGAAGVMAAGLAGAAATITAGLVAAAVVALAPLFDRACRTGPGFARRWLGALALPGLVAALAVLLVSLPHATAHLGTFWTQRYLPLTSHTLGRLGRALVTGEGQPNPYWAEMDTYPVRIAAAVVLGAVMAGLAVAGARTRAAGPARQPFLALALVYPLLLLAVSLDTSLLVPRYFLPACVGVLGLAAIGLDRLWTESPRGRPAVLALLAACGFVGMTQATRPWLSPDPAAAAQSAAVLAFDPLPRTVVTTEYLRGYVETAVLLSILDRPDLSRPTFLFPASPDWPADPAALGPTLVILPAAFWDSAFAARLPAADCLVEQGDVFVATIGLPPPPACLP